MSSTNLGQSGREVSVKTTSFERFSGTAGILAGIAVFLYAVTFFGIQRAYPSLGAWLSGLFLGLTGLFITPLIIGMYARLRETDAAYALWAMLLGFFGAIGLLVDGGYALASEIFKPGTAVLSSTAATPPTAVDPAGILSFGLLGVSFFVVSWLIVKGGEFPRGISYLGYVTAIDMIYGFIARLIIINPTYMSILVPAVVLSFLLLPAWYVWLGMDLARGVVDESIAATAKKPDLYCCSV